MSPIAGRVATVQQEVQYALHARSYTILAKAKKERATSFIDPKFQTRAVVPPIAGSGEVPSPSVGDRPAGGARCITCQELLHHSRINSEANAMQ